MYLFNIIGFLVIIGLFSLQEAFEVSRGNIQTEKFIIYKKDGESDEQYYRRILVRNYYENIIKHEVRVECLKVMLPDLPIWRDDKYLSYVTVDNEYYNRPTLVSDRLNDISKHWDETDDEYYRRIFKKYDDERLDQYMERVGAIKALFHSLSVWANNNYISYVRPYLEPYKREAERVNTETTGHSTSTSTSVTSTSFALSANSPASLGSDTSSVNTGEKHPENEEEEESEKESEEDSEKESEEDSEDESKTEKKKENKGKSTKEKEEKDYHRRQGESDKDYCKRLFGSNKKGHKKKTMKKLKKSLTKREVKKVKEICKKNKK